MTQQQETQHYAITVVGKDQPGIVAAVTGGLFNLGCNIADSSCTMLGGEFAMILIISLKKPFSKSRLIEELKPVCDRIGMTLGVRILHSDEIARREPDGEICMISVYGADQPGIVYRVTRELATRSINITDLNTKLIGTAEEPVYVLMMEVALPEGESPEGVEQTLAALKKELNVEIGVRVITPVAF
jgi:glycine cleavage system transcriptional repressor